MNIDGIEIKECNINYANVYDILNTYFPKWEDDIRFEINRINKHTHSIKVMGALYLKRNVNSDNILSNIIYDDVRTVNCNAVSIVKNDKLSLLDEYVSYTIKKAIIHGLNKLVIKPPLVECTNDNASNNNVSKSKNKHYSKLIDEVETRRKSIEYRRNKYQLKNKIPQF